MQIKIAMRHGHLSDEYQQIIREKTEKLLHFFDRITMIEVTVDLHQDRHKAVEIKVDAEHKHDFVVQVSENGEVMTLVDIAVDKMKHQIHRYKEKLQDHRRDPSTGQGPVSE